MGYKGISNAQKADSSTSPDIINITGHSENEESIHSDNEIITCIKAGHKYSSILYDITIDAETQQCIGPKSVIYKKRGRYNGIRKYSALQPGWTDVISKLCWAKTKIPCVYTFKRAQVYESERNAYITIFGKCKECDAPFRAHSFKKHKGRKQSSVICEDDIRGMSHEKKKRIL